MKSIEILKKIKSDLENQTSHSVDYLLQDEVKKTLSERGIRIRKLFAPILRKVYSTQTPYKLIKDKDKKNKGIIPTKKVGKIFVVNHRQADDIVLAANAIGETGYFVFGNKYLALDTINGLGLWAYGMILLDRDNKTNRKAAYNKMKYVIEHGGNIIIYPEGYWNLADDGEKDERHEADAHNSENWLIQDINIGSIRLAQETQAPIIPVILHYDEIDSKKCYSKKGRPIYVSPTDDIFEKKDEVVEHMQTLYYNLMEKYSSYNRDTLEKDTPLKEQWETLKRQLIADCDIPPIDYKLDLANEKLIGKAKITNPKVTEKQVYAKIKK